jgi:hypothetical protein
VKTKYHELLEEYRAAVDERIAHPKFVSSYLRLVLARAELKEHLMVPWRKRVWRDFVAWVLGRKYWQAGSTSTSYN